MHPGKPLVVGRKRGDLILDDPLVSGSHCRIVHKDGKFVLQDLGSTNGTRVNGERAQKTPLKSGDDVQLGKLKLRVVLPA